MSRRRSRPTGMEPLSPQQKWKAITIATLVLLPAFWGTLIGLVSVASDDGEGVANPAAFIALGLALVPFAFLALAFLSGHPIGARRDGEGDVPVPADRHPGVGASPRTP